MKNSIKTALYAFALVFLLSACGGKDESSSVSSEESASVSSGASVSESVTEEASSEEKLGLRDGAITLAKPGFDQKVKELQQENPDTVGWISIDGTENQYPIMYSGDNDFYLRRDFNKEYDVWGIPYLDMENTPKMIDQNTVIYGHMAPEGDELPMFGIFRRYQDQDFADKAEKTVTITTNYGVFVYRLFSMRDVASDAPYRHANVPEAEYAAFLKETANNSEIDFHYNKPITTKDRVLTLSTCTTQDDESKRIAIVGVLEKAQVTQEVYDIVEKFYAEEAPTKDSATNTFEISDKRP